MPYSAILTNARKITLGRPYLWFFGFLAAFIIQETSANFGSFLGGSLFLFQLGSIFSSPAALTFILIGIGFLMWLWSTAGRICLIYEVATIDMRDSKRKPKSTIRELLPIARHHLLSILGLQVLLWLPVVIFLNASALLAAVGLPEEIGYSFEGIFMIIGGLLSLPIIFVDAFAWRAMIIDEQGIVGSIKKGLHIFRSKVGSVLSISLLCGLLGLVFGLVIGIILLPFISAFFMGPLQMTLSSCSFANGDGLELLNCLQEFTTSPMMVIPLLLLGIVSAALSALWVAYQSAVFTIAYLHLS